MTDTHTIREAARLMRDRANNATPGPWYPDGEIGVYAYGAPETPTCPNVFSFGKASLSDIEHIAGFGPDVATAVADLLDSVADHRDATGSRPEVGADVVLRLAVAYLGDDHPAVAA